MRNRIGSIWAFLIAKRPVLRVIAILLFMHATVSLLTGCAGLPQWLADFQTILPVAEASLSVILGLVVQFSGNAISPAEASSIQTYFHELEQLLSDVMAAVKQYQANPGQGTIQAIENAAGVFIANLESFMKDVHISNPASQQKILTLCQAVLDEFKAWASLIPTIAADAGQKMSFTVPMSKEKFREHFNKLLTAPSEDVDVDEAVLHAKKL